MADNPFKVGDKIVILRSDETREDLYDQVGEVVKIMSVVGSYASIMVDNPFKVGDKIVILRSDETREDLYDQVGEVVKIMSVVGSYASIYVVLPNHNVQGYKQDFQWTFAVSDTLTQRLGFADKQTPTNSSRQEKPCQVCKRPNDLGVKSCWSCGNAPF